MITKEAKNTSTYYKYCHYFNSARNAFKYILSEVLNPSDVILMPAYIGESQKEGSGVFDPIRDTKVSYIFYEINENLMANVSDIKQKIKENKNIKAILLIHYFGFPQEAIYDIKQLCEQYNIILIEDCAHCLESKYKSLLLGTIGDFSFNSIHKLIATNDGGVLRINNPKWFDLKPEENLIRYDTLIQYFNTDIQKTSQKRIDNFNYYLEHLPSNTTMHSIMYKELPSGTVPLNFPILIKNFDRFKYYNMLIEKGVITVALYYQMIKELSSELFPYSFKISREILNLPVHQDIDFSDIDFIIDKMLEVENECRI